MISQLALVDLAGSERCARTGNTGEKLKEAGEWGFREAGGGGGVN